MEILTLREARHMLLTFSANDSHHTVQHSLDTLRIGRQIAGTRLTQALACALVLHDIGYFIEDDATNPSGHSIRARRYLEKQGIQQPEILLPIACHEADDKLEMICRADTLFPTQDEKRGQKILWSCMLLCEADIISHMQELLTELPSENENYSACFLLYLESGLLPSSVEVIFPCDRILYLLCGLALIRLRESFCYLWETKLVHQLILRLPEGCRSRVSEIIHEKYALQ